MRRSLCGKHKRAGGRRKGGIWLSVLAILILVGMYVGSPDIIPGDMMLPDMTPSSMISSEMPQADMTSTDITSAEIQTAQEDSDSERLEVHFIDVGQGDATLILCGGDAMLIDAGDNAKGTKIQNYLQKQEVETLKYVVCTHPDADHIGGMDVILYKFDCETILMTDEKKDSNTYRDVVDVMKNKGYRNTLPVVGEQYSLGSAVFTIVGPDCVGSDSNNNSIVVILAHGENTFLFMGDAEAEEEAAMLESGISLDADVVKVGHHGSRSSSSQELLNAVTPDYAVISCAEGNTYGHPHAETLNNLRGMGVQVFRTDEQGSVVAVSDGEEITWNCSPSETWQSGEPTGSLP